MFHLIGPGGPDARCLDRAVHTAKREKRTAGLPPPSHPVEVAKSYQLTIVATWMPCVLMSL